VCGRRRNPVGCKPSSSETVHPHEAPLCADGAQWRDLKDRTLLIHATKTSRRWRSVPLMASLRSTSRSGTWRRGDRTRTRWCSRGGGEQWTDGDLRNWRNRIYKPPLALLGDRATPSPRCGCTKGAMWSKSLSGSATRPA
jgi:hypothetical protein